MFRHSLTALSIALSVLAPSTVAGASPHHPVWSFLQPTQLQMKQWSWVGWCETHDSWTRVGSLYTGALGITRHNWTAFGGTQFSTLAANARPFQQVIVAMRINRGYPVPDQPTGVYCDPKGW